METEAGPPLALHVCCGPCSTAVIERLQAEWDVHAIWYNPNIQPSEEHRTRLDAMRRVAQLMDTPLMNPGYDVDDWMKACAGLMGEPEGGARCHECFRLRLRRTALWALEQEKPIGIFSTTLTLSPHKPTEIMNEIGEEVAAEFGIDFLTRDFKQQHGFQRSVELSKRWGIYRQDYCGCLPSRRG